MEGAKLILSSVGIDILESQKIVKINPDKKKERFFHFNIKNAKAKMKIEEEKFIVLKGSTAVIENRPSADASIINMRNRLISDGVIVNHSNDTLYIFKEDYSFNSPSYAASAISGGHENGRIQWKWNGKSLNQIEEAEIEEIIE